MKSSYRPVLFSFSWIAIVLVVYACSSGKRLPDHSAIYLLVGTYTQSQTAKQEMDSGIYVYRMDTATGALTFVSASPFTSNPSFLAIHPSKNIIYAVNEDEIGGISAFQLDSGSLSLHWINKTDAGGRYPCHLLVTSDGQHILAANYGSGNITGFPVETNGAVGSLSFSSQHAGTGPDKERQEGPHAHMVLESPDHRQIYSADLGTDKIYIDSLDAATGKLIANCKPAVCNPGSGPRHIVFNHAGTRLYVLTELSGKILCYNRDTVSGTLTLFQTISVLPAGDSGIPASAEILLAPDERFVYASNRAEENNIAILEVNQTDGILSLRGHQAAGGKTPRSIAISPDGKFLLSASQGSGLISIFRLNKGTGLPEETGLSTAVPSPVCLLFFRPR